MANHSDDDNSSFGAPENFHITAENEDGSHWSSNQVKCPLCNYSRKSFYCRFCIRDGNFTHTSHHLAERYGIHCVRIHSYWLPFKDYFQFRRNILCWLSSFICILASCLHCILLLLLFIVCVHFILAVKYLKLQGLQIEWWLFLEFVVFAFRRIQSSLKSNTYILIYRFCEKQLKHKNLKSVHRAQQATCIQLLQNRKMAEDLQFAIKQKRENISLLKKLIDEREMNTKKLREKNQRLTNANRSSRKQVPQYIAKCQQFADYIVKTDDRNGKLNEDRINLHEQLQQCRVQNIVKLIKFIFPLSERISKGDHIVVPSTENSVGDATGPNAADLGATAVCAETMNALAEATHTAYIRGRWILQDSHGELQHVIVAPSLPGIVEKSKPVKLRKVLTHWVLFYRFIENGDYSAYNDWVAITKDGVPNAPGTTETLTSINCAYRISAALTYTTQLIHLLSYYLDVRLPFKINYR